jgi:hypothetical protein
MLQMNIDIRYLQTKLEISLTDAQWGFLNALSEIWQNVSDPEKLQSEIFVLAKAQKLDLSLAFRALYTVTLDKNHGPRAGWLLKKFPVESIVQRHMLNKSETKVTEKRAVTSIEKPDFITIDTELKKAIPTITVGVALIRNVTINKTDPKLEEEKQVFIKSIAGLTNEMMGTYPELVSYRRLYKQMGIDWHSRRPSPEALLRRVAQGKDLYTVNTCVDAYNLVVMKHRISVGAFDHSSMSYPRYWFGRGR